MLLVTCSLASVLKFLYLEKNVRNLNAEEILLILTNVGQLSFNQMGELLILPMTVHINKLSMAKILSFAEVSNIAVVHIKMDISKKKFINFHIRYRNIIHFKACAEGISATTLMTQVG